MKLEHIFIDFDETLFNHYAFLDWLDDQLHRQGYLKADKGSFKTTIDDYHQIVTEQPLHRLYKHEEHLQATTMHTWDSFVEATNKLIKEQNKDFCYPEAHEFIDWATKLKIDVRILTFGDNAYQHFKIETCPYLKTKGLKIHVVQESKANFLGQYFGRDTGLLVDDKYPLGLPQNWHHVWINRREPLRQPKILSDQETQVYELTQVKQAVDLLDKA